MASFIIQGSIVYSNTSQDIVENGFKGGVYTVKHDRNSGITSIDTFKVESDEIISLPKSSYFNIMSDVEYFFTAETKQRFKEYGFLYKKAILLHGKPGTGKTCIVVKLIDTFIKTYKNGLVFFNPDLFGFDAVIKLIHPDVPILVAFEEFDSICENYSEDRLLSLLDGQVQRPNTFYVFTTNFLDKIPKRLFRPSRISDSIEIGLPKTEARLHYLNAKIKNSTSDEDIQKWAELTDGLTIDDLKHTVLAVKCLNKTLEDVIPELIKNHEILDQYNKKPKEHGLNKYVRNKLDGLFGYDDGEENDW